MSKCPVILMLYVLLSSVPAAEHYSAWRLRRLAQLARELSRGYCSRLYERERSGLAPSVYEQTTVRKQANSERFRA